MKVVKGNIWDYWKQGHWIVIPTNGNIKKDDSAVMGRGLALQAKKYVPRIEYILGDWIKKFGNNVYYADKNIISFPVKKNWWEMGDLKLIESSAKQLLELIKRIEFNSGENFASIYLPKVGCGNGKLSWLEVELILDEYLDERFMVVDLK